MLSHSLTVSSRCLAGQHTSHPGGQQAAQSCLWVARFYSGKQLGGMAQ